VAQKKTGLGNDEVVCTKLKHVLGNEDFGFDFSEFLINLSVDGKF
jgi:hypothetical protein